MWLKQNTASQEILLGPFLDDTDGKTAETGLTIANTDIQLFKDGSTAEVNKNSGGATHISNGRYYAVLDATDTNTLGKLEVNVFVSGALPVRREFIVLPANAYDSLVSGTDYLQADAMQIEGADATDQINAACDVAISDASLATSAALATAQTDLDTLTGTDGVTLATSQPNYAPNTTTPPTAAAVADAVWDEARSAHTSVGSFGEGVKVESLNTQAKADVNAEADTAISDASLATASALATVDSNVDAILLDTGTTLPGTLSTIDSKVDTIDGIVDAILLDTGTDGVVISTAQAQTLADEVLKRSVTNTQDSADAHSLAAIVLGILESSRSETTWTIKKTTGSTFTTKTLTLDADADPVTGVT